MFCAHFERLVDTSAPNWQSISRSAHYTIALSPDHARHQSAITQNHRLPRHVQSSVMERRNWRDGDEVVKNSRQTKQFTNRTLSSSISKLSLDLCSDAKWINKKNSQSSAVNNLICTYAHSRVSVKVSGRQNCQLCKQRSWDSLNFASIEFYKIPQWWYLSLINKKNCVDQNWLIEW